MQYLVFYVNEIAGWHTNVSVNGSKASLPLQGNPLGWHGLIQWAAGWMTHSGEACRIVEETIPGAGVRSVSFSSGPLKKNKTEGDARCHTCPLVLIHEDNSAAHKEGGYKNIPMMNFNIKSHRHPPSLGHPWFSLSPLSFSLLHHFRVKSDHLHISLVIYRFLCMRTGCTNSADQRISFGLEDMMSRIFRRYDWKFKSHPLLFLLLLIASYNYIMKFLKKFTHLTSNDFPQYN